MLSGASASPSVLGVCEIFMGSSPGPWFRNPLQCGFWSWRSSLSLLI